MTEQVWVLNHQQKSLECSYNISVMLNSEFIVTALCVLHVFICLRGLNRLKHSQFCVFLLFSPLSNSCCSPFEQQRATATARPLSPLSVQSKLGYRSSSPRCFTKEPKQRAAGQHARKVKTARTHYHTISRFIRLITFNYILYMKPGANACEGIDFII